jgi:hypothetical protein
MTARIVNADTLYQGDSLDVVVQVYDSSNLPVTLPTGTVGTVIYGIYQSDKSTTFLVKKIIGDGIVVRAQSGSDVGKFDLVLAGSDTENLYGDLYHECVVTIDGKARTIFYGKFPVRVSSIK